MPDDKLTKVKIYEAVQKGISETDTISFKLIGFVPLVSGTALLTILFGQTATPILPLLSLFAAAITLGLLWWELWNIQTCHWFINLAKKLEEEADPKHSYDRPNPPGNVGKHNAAKIIYATTILTWLMLPIVMGGSWTQSPVLIVLYAAFGLVIAAGTICAIWASTEPPTGGKQDMGPVC